MGGSWIFSAETIDHKYVVKQIIYYDLFSTAYELKDKEIHCNSFQVWINKDFEATIRKFKF